MTEEANLVKRLQSSTESDKAFEELLALYHRPLYWYIRKLVVTHENADDVLQNTFIRVHKAIGKFEQRSSLKTWMYRIAYNEAMRLLESRKKRYYISIDDVNDTSLEALVDDAFFEGKEIQVKLQATLATLSERDRKIFQMKYYDDLKFREISKILGIKEGTLKSSYYASVKYISEQMTASFQLRVTEEQDYEQEEVRKH